MTALVQLNFENSVTQQIQYSIGWMGHISGLKAEKMLRGKKTPFLYLLRQGETEFDFYLTYVDSDLTVRHQPFTITGTLEYWSYENGFPMGPFINATIEDVVHLIMHCGKDDCTPYVDLQ